MRAVVVTDFDTEPSVAELPVPDPGPEEVLVRLAAAGVNPFDWKVVEGAMRGSVEHAFPLVLGSDGAGTVERVGEGVDFAPGDRVFGQFMDVQHGRGSADDDELHAGPIQGVEQGLEVSFPRMARHGGNVPACGQRGWRSASARGETARATTAAASGRPRGSPEEGDPVRPRPATCARGATAEMHARMRW